MGALGIDVGTTNVKVVLVRSDGTLVRTASRPLRTDRDGDVVTQDPSALWDAVVDAVGEVCASSQGDAASVQAIGVCSQYSSIVPVDVDGSPLAPVKMYFDRRGTDACWEVMARHPEAFGTWVERHGVPPVGGGLSLGHLLWFQHHEPEVHRRCASYLEVMDYVAARLTGRRCATQGTMFTAQLCDNRQLGVTSYDPDLVAMSGVDAERLPPLVGPGDTVGELRGDLARRWGLPSGVGVAATMNDTHAGAFATGAWQGATAGLMVGTTAVLVDHLDSPRSDLDHEIVALPGPLGDRWLVWAENGLAGRAVSHVLDDIVYADDPLGSHGTTDGFAALDATVRSVPAGSDGVLFGPWLTGSMSPASSSAMRGAFVNLTLDTGRAHLVRAALEGIALNAGWLLPAVEALCGRPAERIVLGGGAARSAVWSGVFADVLDRPVYPLDDPAHAVARAVALVALWGPDVVVDDPDGVVVDTQDACVPDPSNRAIYDEAQRSFVALFEALRSVAERTDG